MRLIVGAMAAGLGIAALYSLQAAGIARFFATVGVLVAVSGAATVSGALLGFVFGIPRALQSGAAAPAAQPTAQGAAANPPADPRYGANTSLEQISDWLTKILVGVGLTQLTQVPGALQSYAAYVAQALPGLAGAAVFAAAATLYFATCGFLASYLWTRLKLGEALSRAEVMTRAEFEQARQSNSHALQLVEQQLRRGAEAPAAAELARAIADADDLYRAHIFELARRERKDAEEKHDGERIARTMPVFRALIDRNPDRFHQSHGQLGFAQLHVDPPDLDGSERSLTRAIQIRGEDWRRYGYTAYELARALCRIRRAGPGTAAPAPLREAVLRDLQVLSQWPVAQLDEQTIADLAAWGGANDALDDLERLTGTRLRAAEAPRRHARAARAAPD
jgi:hypothetical protein